MKSIKTILSLTFALSVSACGTGFTTFEFARDAIALRTGLEAVNLDAAVEMPDGGSATYEGLAGGGVIDPSAPVLTAVGFIGTMVVDAQFDTDGVTVDGTISDIGMASLTEDDFNGLDLNDLETIDADTIETILDGAEAADGSFTIAGQTDPSPNNDSFDGTISGTVSGEAGEVGLDGAITGQFLGGNAEVLAIAGITGSGLTATLNGEDTDGGILGIATR